MLFPNTLICFDTNWTGRPTDDQLVVLPNILKLTAHAVRWHLLRLTAHSDYRVHDLVEELHLPQNLVSYQLKQLRQGQLVTERLSSAEERFIFYDLEVERTELQLTIRIRHLLTLLERKRDHARES